MTEPDNPPKRRPGAPKGNRNAFKHGRYSAKRIGLRRRLRSLVQTGELADRLARVHCRATSDTARLALLDVLYAVTGSDSIAVQITKFEEQLSCAAPG